MNKLTCAAITTIAALSVSGLLACDDETTDDGTGGSSTSTSGTGGSGGSSSGTGGSASGTGGSSSGTGGGGGGGGSACDLVDAGDDCNTLTNTAAAISQVDSTDTLPTGVGGEIVNGVYHTTDMTAYADSPALGAGVVLEQTWEFCDGAGHLVGVDDDNSTTYHKNFDIEPDGTVPNATTTCTTQDPNTEIAYSSYTATSNSLILYSTTFGISVTLTLQ